MAASRRSMAWGWREPPGDTGWQGCRRAGRCSAAWTRAVSVSSVSSGRIGDVGGGEHRARRRRPRRGRGGPSRRCAVRSPASASCHARSMAWVPGSSPGSAGWRLTTAREPAEEAHRQDAHPPGEHDDVGPMAGDDVGEPGVVVGRASPARRATWTAGTPARRARSSAPASARSETTATTSARQAAVGAGVEDRLQVGARRRTPGRRAEPSRSSRPPSLDVDGAVTGELETDA